MISTAIINLSLVGLACVLLLYYLIRFVIRYKHEYESNPLCTLTVVFCLFVVLLATFVLPVDIFLVSFVKEPDGTFKEWATNETLAKIDEAVFDAYYALYGIITFLIFIIIPFLHFLNEESESNSQDRLYKSIKYTFVFSIIMTILLAIGAIMHTTDVDPDLIFNKILHILKTTRFQDALTMVLTIITTAGFLNVTFYTASGLFSWPIGLLLGTSSVASRVNAVNDRETILRIKICNLQEKARQGRLTPAEREELLQAEIDLSDLKREETALSGYRNSITYKLRKAIRPIQIVTGTLFGLLSIFMIVTLILVNVDRIMHGAGARQGYVLLKPEIFNPLEYVYVKLQSIIFVGPVPLLLVTCFLVIATISGIRNLGLWFLFTRIHRIKVGRTQPQALLFFCITLMLAALSFNLILYSMTTEFVTFGNQNFRQEVNGTVVVKPCTLADNKEGCILTRSSIFLMRMMSQLWIFGAIFYWWTWAFVGVALISFVAFLVRGRRVATHGIATDEDEFED